MPSFTLLGPQVIRFPFILTLFLSARDSAQLVGQFGLRRLRAGQLVRRPDRVPGGPSGTGTARTGGRLPPKHPAEIPQLRPEGRDFPLTEFRSRHSAATEAVGYGKALMMDHMLRRQMGDDAFRSALASFYRKFRGKRASFDDLQYEYETITQTDLGPFFAQWIERTGAPALAVDKVVDTKSRQRFCRVGYPEADASEEPYDLDVPVTVLTISGPLTSVVTCTARGRNSRSRSVTRRCRCRSIRCLTCSGCSIRERRRPRSGRSSASRRSWPCCRRRPARIGRGSIAS